jgi:3-deoxy-manno-octulosonate cytidylyltransferase (CMP-KDO synthetase)
MNPVILIPARMKATRLPDKPLADLHGKPMIVHVMERSRASNVGKVAVACDDERIAEAVRRAGGEAILTDKNHASGSDRIYEALQKIDPQEQYDVVINVQGDLPTIDPKIISAVLEPLKNEHYSIATLACKIKDEREISDPAVVKPILSFKSNGKIADALDFTRVTPQDKNNAYHHIGLYAYRRSALKRFVSLPPSAGELREKLEQLRALENGMRIGVVIVDTVPLGVDTPEHLEKARAMLQFAG